MLLHTISKIKSRGKGGVQKIKGQVILLRSNSLDYNEIQSSVLDNISEFWGAKVSFQLISSENGDRSKELQGKVGKKTYLGNWMTKMVPVSPGETMFKISFVWEEDIGIPGAFIIRNNHFTKFFLKSLTLEDVPFVGRIHFDCNSWIYPSGKYKNDRIFFINKAYIPNETPEPLRKYRQDELKNLRGDGTGERQEWDRIYDYDVYNDLEDPSSGSTYIRPVLGGSTQYPYPRRGRTGRSPSKKDKKYESRLSSSLSLNTYVPRDERFGHLKESDFLAYTLKSVAQSIKPALDELFSRNPGEFDSFQDVLNLYEGGFSLPKSLLEKFRQNIPAPLLKEIFRTDGENFLKFPLPQVIQDNKSGWRTDEEFAREMLAGVNPIIIRRLQEFPPSSKLDPNVYGDQNSKISEEHIINSLDGLTVQEAIEQNKLYILDHHDALMPYLNRINSTSTKTYATRTLLFLNGDGTLRPLVIELSLPQSQKDELGATSKLYFPAEDGVESSIWQLAKAYVAVNDAGYHQVVSHWLNTHAVMEPFVIATNRQLSVLHPIHKLLVPHYRDTMNINAFARQTLVNADGILESTHFQSKYSMELSSYIYKDWVFTDQALPRDLIKRGMAVEDSNSPYGLKLLIEDYPFAVDGLEIWFAIKTWVKDYCSSYYKDDIMVHDDVELQSWWKELKEKGHVDLKDKPWWPKMETLEVLIETCTIIIWISSALHAAVNFGQYPYGGYLPNRPTISRRFMPEKGTPQYIELESDPEKGFLRTINSQVQTLLEYHWLRSCQGILLMRFILEKERVLNGFQISQHWKLLKSLGKDWKKLSMKL
ncbi:hypothetical protein Csa_023391 [Cucumis sativus]|nr:hypothetical protein Csa_023391 [Cucumis sativus]